MKRVVLLAAAACLLSVAGRAQAPRPNILFVISDDQSAMHAGAYGDTATHTPAFDRIAREGVLFNHAYAAAPSCAPSRSAILTGRNIWEVEEGGILLGMLRSKFKVFPLLLEDAGYQLGATGKTWGPGKLGPGWTREIFGKVYAAQRLEDPSPGINPVDYAANFDEFFAERDQSKPFFFWLGTTEPHQSYDVGAWKRAGKKLEDARLPAWLPDTPETRGEILDYGLEIEHFDSNLARVIATLEAAGELDNT
ncbi:MAG: sulfatase-like hydrolase/transferase, partial [Acidobacteria bacterium]|nr:sulfatase-like hydrolase/transferase [Acidobacteriota bacterium]